MAQGIHIQVPRPQAKVKPGILVASGSIGIPYNTLTAVCASGSQAIGGTEVARLGPRSHDNSRHSRWAFAFKIPNPTTATPITYTLTVSGTDSSCSDLKPQSTTFTVAPTTSHLENPARPFDPVNYPTPGTETDPTSIEVEDFTPYGDLPSPLESVMLYDFNDPNHPAPIYPLFVFADPNDLQFWTAQFDTLTQGNLYELVLKIQSQPPLSVPGLMAKL